MTICANCYERTEEVETCEHCGALPRLHDAYVLEDIIGEGAQGITFRARRIDDDQIVAVKQFVLRRASSWKTLEQLDREAATLESIEHSRVPTYYDYFSIVSGPAVAFYLVQEFVAGEDLAGMRPMPLERAIELTVAALDILADLHDRPVPVIHRDVKPSNLVLREDGQIVLVDFGSVRSDHSTGSTIAGTFGYMAPEQFAGEATPASDVYGAGATLVALLAGRDASDLQDGRNPDWWRSAVQLPQRLQEVLTRVLSPEPSERPGARAAAAELRAVAESLVPVEPTDTTELSELSDNSSKPVQSKLPATTDALAVMKQGEISELLAGQEILPQANVLTERQRSKIRKQHDADTIAFLGGIVLAFMAAVMAAVQVRFAFGAICVMGVLGGRWWWNSRKLARLCREAILNDGSLALGTVMTAQASENGVTYRYRYEVPSDSDSFRPAYEDTIRSSEVLGLRRGSKVLVAFNPEAPRENVVVATDS